MHIQSYQIHNVLNVYRRQLSQGKPSGPSQPTPGSNKTGSESLAAKSNNQTIMEKVADTVLKKITNIDPDTDFGKEMLSHAQPIDNRGQWSKKKDNFVFNTIAENNRKETRTITVDDSQILINRLDELAKAAITSKDEKNN